MQGLLELKINFFWWYMKNYLLNRGIRTQDLSIIVICFNNKTTATHSPCTYMGSLTEPSFSRLEICPRGKGSNTTETNYFIFVVFCVNKFLTFWRRRNNFTFFLSFAKEAEIRRSQRKGSSFPKSSSSSFRIIFLFLYLFSSTFL